MPRYCGVSAALPSARTLLIASVAIATFLVYSSHYALILGTTRQQQVNRELDVPEQRRQISSPVDSSLFVGNEEQRKQQCRCEKECKRCLKRAYSAAAERTSQDNEDGGGEQESENGARAPDADPGGGSDADATSTTSARCEAAKMSVNGEYQQSVYILKRSGSAGAGRKEAAAAATGTGKHNKDTILWPFSFIKKYCDIPGMIQAETTGDGGGGDGGFVFEHSHGRLYHPTAAAPYRATGPYITFENSSVETRGQVQCIDGAESVPRSQRDDRVNSYFYPTQIAQFGLKHYSRLKSQGEIRSWLLLDDGKGSGKKRWIGSSKVSYADGTMRFRTAGFSTEDTGHEDRLHMDTKSMKPTDKSSPYHPSILMAQVQLGEQAAITVRLRVLFYNQKTMPSTVHTLHYVSKSAVPHISKPIHCDKASREVYHHLGDDSGQWRTVVRDLAVDVMKGIAMCQGVKRKSSLADFITSVHVQSVQLHGTGSLRQLSLNSSAHERMFMSAAGWFVRNQDAHGGWPIPVKRQMSRGMSPLQPGWKSAMAQGQAISLLVRAYDHTHKEEFLDAAAKAIEPFKHLSKDGGVRAVFMDQYVWYEEYPTSPALFVLNGFISSMLGLYDLAEVMKDARGQQAAVAAQRLFDAGFKSLHALLPLYDTGSGSIYDLRHFMTRQAPNVVRAEYHVTHINQLATLTSIFPDDEQLKTFYQRWLGYHNGHRVSRN
ncbi:D-glucuronyl C5-epimerase-like [Sycon ciliatum]|uniref:D-glucuronyl C5-epimerase-like n=1 Tax=Sycon ciliatum TaxID=27933 RepID=UPI0031F6488C